LPTFGRPRIATAGAFSPDPAFLPGLNQTPQLNQSLVKEPQKFVLPNECNILLGKIERRFDMRQRHD
jgi:hypothetical protein